LSNEQLVKSVDIESGILTGIVDSAMVPTYKIQKSQIQMSNKSKYEVGKEDAKRIKMVR
jgi:hypothetical protein